MKNISSQNALFYPERLSRRKGRHCAPGRAETIRVIEHFADEKNGKTLYRLILDAIIREESNNERGLQP